MNNIDKAWLAGILEGEAAFTVHEYSYERYGTTYGPYTNVKLRIGSIDKDMLDEVVRITGIGKVTGPIQHRNKAWTDYYHWEIAAKKVIATLLSEVIPYMRVERRVAQAKELYEKSNVPRKKDRRTA